MHLIARFYGRVWYTIWMLNELFQLCNRTTSIPWSTIHIHLCLQVILIFKTVPCILMDPWIPVKSNTRLKWLTQTRTLTLTLREQLGFPSTMFWQQHLLSMFLQVLVCDYAWNNSHHSLITATSLLHKTWQHEIHPSCHYPVNNDENQSKSYTQFKIVTSSACTCDATVSVYE